MTVSEIPAGSPNTASPLERWWLALLVAGVTVIVAATFITSFDAQAAVARDRGAVTPHLAWAIPLAVDGMILVGSTAAWITAIRDGRWHAFPLLVVAAAGSVSVVTNVAHATGGDWLARTLAAVPPVALLAAVELGAWLIRHRVNAAVSTATKVQQSLHVRGEGATQPPQRLQLAQPAQPAAQDAAPPVLEGDYAAAVHYWLECNPGKTIDDVAQADIVPIVQRSPSAVSRNWDRTLDEVRQSLNGAAA